MLTVVETSWDAFAGGLLLLAGFLIAILQKSLFGLSVPRAVLLYTWHTAFCLAYLAYSLENVADSTLYYLNSFALGYGPSVGTAGVVYFTSFFSQGLGLSYGVTFLVFNLFGSVGLLGFASAVQVATADASPWGKRMSLLVLLIPGLSFWSSAIGKDSLSMFATGVICWVALKPVARFPAFVLAMAVLTLARPHMSALLVLSISAAALFSSQTGVLKKVLTLALVAPAAFVMVQFGLSYVGLGDAQELGDVTDYMAERQGRNSGGGSSINITAMSVPMRFFAYLYRPLFFDSPGTLGLVVSAENALLLALTVIAVLKLRYSRSSLPPFARTFFLVYVALSLVVLANTTANLGIAVRQKWMFLPMLIIVCLSYFSQTRRQTASERSRERHGGTRTTHGTGMQQADVRRWNRLHGGAA